MATGSAEEPTFNYAESVRLVEEQSELKIENGVLAWEGLEGLLDSLEKSYVKSVTINNMKLIQMADLEDVICCMQFSQSMVSSIALTKMDLRDACCVITGLLEIVYLVHTGQ